MRAASKAGWGQEAVTQSQYLVKGQPKQQPQPYLSWAHSLLKGAIITDSQNIQEKVLKTRMTWLNVQRQF